MSPTEKFPNSQATINVSLSSRHDDTSNPNGNGKITVGILHKRRPQLDGWDHLIAEIQFKRIKYSSNGKRHYIFMQVSNSIRLYLEMEGKDERRESCPNCLTADRFDFDFIFLGYFSYSCTSRSRAKLTTSLFWRQYVWNISSFKTLPPKWEACHRPLDGIWWSSLYDLIRVFSYWICCVGKCSCELNVHTFCGPILGSHLEWD